MVYIGAHGVAALHRYKYSGVDHSYLAKYVLQPFWSRFVNFFPLWMPPNMITLTGFMFLLVSALLGYIYSPQLDTAPPRWVNFAHGLLLFLYQTFDAVDGKQARRTNSSSPLGELFDHGCDALACTFEALAFGSTAMCGRNTFWFWLISAITFYGATWEHFFTNTLILPVVNGPTEGLMLIYVAHFFTAFVGSEWWAQQFGKSFPFLSWLPFVGGFATYKVVLFLMIAFGVIPTVTFNVCNVHKVVKSRNGSMPLALAMLYPFAVLVGGVLIWDYLSPSDIIRSYPHLVIIGTGLTFGYLVGRMILSHLCDEPKGLKTGMCMVLRLFIWIYIVTNTFKILYFLTYFLVSLVLKPQSRHIDIQPCFLKHLEQLNFILYQCLVCFGYKAHLIFRIFKQKQLILLILFDAFYVVSQSLAAKIGLLEINCIQILSV